MKSVGSVLHPRQLKELTNHFNEVDLTFFLPEEKLLTRLIISKDTSCFKQAVSLTTEHWYFVSGPSVQSGVDDEYVFEPATPADMERLARQGLLNI